MDVHDTRKLLPVVAPGRGSKWLEIGRLFTVHCFMPLNFKACAYITVIIIKCLMKSNKTMKEGRQGGSCPEPQLFHKEPVEGASTQGLSPSAKKKHKNKEDLLHQVVGGMQ